MRFTREQYLDLLTSRSVERQMFVELFGLLVGLEGEWRSQGATQEEIDLIAFDWDYAMTTECPCHTGPRGGYKEVVISETDDYIIRRDHLGRTMKLCKGYATIPLPLDYPVSDMDSWLAIKPMFVFGEDRINMSRVDFVKEQRKKGSLVVAHIPGGFDLPRQLMGDETACLSYYENPELMHDILATLSDTAYRTLEIVSRHITIDQLFVHEDLAGKSGPLVGPTQVRDFIKPYYRKIWDMLESRGAVIFQQDSDGNISAVIDAFMDCGVNSFYPMEPAAGMDIVEVKRRYGERVMMLGGIDKHVLRQGKEAIRQELEYKMQPMMQQGGVVFGLDHRIPGGTSIENYRYYVDYGRELLGIPPREPRKTRPMAPAFRTR